MQIMMRIKDKERENSSSEDETLINNAKKAIDQQFLRDINNKVKPETHQPNRKSLRMNSEQQDIFTNCGVSPAFQNIAAKKLDEILKRTIKLKDNKHVECMEQKLKKNKNLGIKLLSTSKACLITETTEEHAKKCEKKLKKKKYEIIEDDDEEEDDLLKYREVAIDPKRILSQSDIKHWVNRRPEPDFKYKRLKTGVLERVI